MWIRRAKACCFIVGAAMVVMLQADEGHAAAQDKSEQAVTAKIPIAIDTTKALRWTHIVGSGHGAIFLADGSSIRPNAEVVEKLLDSFLEDLSAPIEDDADKGVYQFDPNASSAYAALKAERERSAKDRARFDAALTQFKFADIDERMLVKALLLQVVLSGGGVETYAFQGSVAADQRPSLDLDTPYSVRRADILLDFALRNNRRGLFDLRPELVAWINTHIHESILDLLRKRTGSDNNYVRRCAENGVPTPPDWPNALYWSEPQPLPYAVNVLRLGENTKVSIYQAPPGVQEGICIALPRTGADGVTDTFGVICQSKRTGKACFFDNIRPDRTVISAPEATFAMRMNEIQNGDNLVQNCTECHRGYNVFLVTPDTPLQHEWGNSDVRYAPVSAQARWSNPPPLHAQGSIIPGSDADGSPGRLRACARCHEIPRLSGNYCASVLSSAAVRTMPNPALPAGWPPAGMSPYAEHIGDLIRACSSPMP